jgi:hypothetical protein
LPRVVPESIVCREVSHETLHKTFFHCHCALFSCRLGGSTGFYFQGLSAPTQMRNTAAARFGTTRYVIAGLVDTSGYSADVREKYVGFLITDSAITLGGESLAPGAYGFGFANEGKITIMDLAGKDLLSVAITNDTALRRPRPLMMSADPAGVRLYNGKNYVVIAAK